MSERQVRRFRDATDRAIWLVIRRGGIDIERPGVQEIFFPCSPRSMEAIGCACLKAAASWRKQRAKP